VSFLRQASADAHEFYGFGIRNGIPRMPGYLQCCNESFVLRTLNTNGRIFFFRDWPFEAARAVADMIQFDSSPIWRETAITSSRRRKISQIARHKTALLIF
jgi:hypothetical protein